MKNGEKRAKHVLSMTAALENTRNPEKIIHYLTTDFVDDFELRIPQRNP